MLYFSPSKYTVVLKSFISVKFFYFPVEEDISINFQKMMFRFRFLTYKTSLSEGRSSHLQRHPLHAWSQEPDPHSQI
jgi:hypothetical protein